MKEGGVARQESRPRAEGLGYSEPRRSEQRADAERPGSSDVPQGMALIRELRRIQQVRGEARRNSGPPPKPNHPRSHEVRLLADETRREPVLNRASSGNRQPPRVSAPAGAPRPTAGLAKDMTRTQRGGRVARESTSE